MNNKNKIYININVKKEQYFLLNNKKGCIIIKLDNSLTF